MAELNNNNELALLRQALVQLRKEFDDRGVRLETFQDKQREINTQTAAQFAVLNLKAGAWGAISSAIVVIAALLLKLI